MDNILRHPSCIFADAIRAAGAEAKKQSISKISREVPDAIRAAGAEAKSDGSAQSAAYLQDAIRAAGAEAKRHFPPQAKTGFSWDADYYARFTRSLLRKSPGDCFSEGFQRTSIFFAKTLAKPDSR